jgi:DNA-binding Lrp family transcriptional regulator
MDSIETYVTSQPSISWAGRVTGEYSFLIRVDEGAPGTIAKILRDLGELRGVSETKTMSVVEQIRKLLNQRSV